MPRHEIISSGAPPLQQQLKRQIQLRARRRVRNLAVEIGSDGIVLRGRATSCSIEQLAQQGVRDVLPAAPLRNAIAVDLSASPSRPWR